MRSGSTVQTSFGNYLGEVYRSRLGPLPDLLQWYKVDTVDDTSKQDKDKN